MGNYLYSIEATKKRFAPLKGEKFERATSGTRHEVFISNKFVIRFQDNNPNVLSREADFLKKIDHQLIPKILFYDDIDGSPAMVEGRLPGEGVDNLWKTLSKNNQNNITNQVIEFLKFLKTQKKDRIYSVNSGTQYLNFFACLIDGIDTKIEAIKKNHRMNKILDELLSVVKNEENFIPFFTSSNTALVHGDLIIHNLLTDGFGLTGVLDWELALFGDPDYDLIRLFYYQECARAYLEQGIDETYEADYMNKLMIEIARSNLIENKASFVKKYQFCRALFFINSLYWLINSKSSVEDIYRLVEQWNKKVELGI